MKRGWHVRRQFAKQLQWPKRKLNGSRLNWRPDSKVNAVSPATPVLPDLPGLRARTGGMASTEWMARTGWTARMVETARTGRTADRDSMGRPVPPEVRERVAREASPDHLW